MAYYQNTTPREDTVARRPMTENDILFLAELQRLLNTQDTMSQADPRFWVIKGSKTEACPYYEADDVRIVSSGGDAATGLQQVRNWFRKHAPVMTREGNELQLIDIGDQDIHGMVMLPPDGSKIPIYCTSLFELSQHLLNLGASCDGRPISVVYTKTTPYIYPDTLFLTHADAEDHLRRNAHNYSEDAHAFSMTAVRSPRVETLWKLLQTVDFSAIAADRVSRQQVMDALDTEQADINGMLPEDGDNDCTHKLKQAHFTSELRAVRRRLDGLFRKGD